MLDLLLELSLLALLIVLGLTLILALSVLARVLVNGPSEIDKLKKQGFGFWVYITGSLPKQSGGANIDVIEGVELLANDRRIVKVRQTRALSDELL